MKKQTTVPILFFYLIALAFVCKAGPALAQEKTSFALNVLNENATSVTFELLIHDVAIDELEQNGHSFSKVSVEGMAVSVMPRTYQLPTIGKLVGLGSSRNVSPEILESTVEAVAGLAPALVSEYTIPQNLASDDPGIHQSPVILQRNLDLSALPPTVPVTPIVHLGEIGYVREQAVAQIQFNPISYESNGQVQIHRRIVAKISWEPEVQAANTLKTSVPKQESAIWKTFIDNTIINSAVANQGGLGVEQKEASREVSPANAASSSEPGVSTQRLLKLGVSQTGIYRLTYPMLQSAGLDPSLYDPRYLGVQNQGAEVATLFIGEEDGRFDVDDSILFYGVAYEDRYTEGNVYWLIYSAEPGLRMATRPGGPDTSAPPATCFLDAVHAEEETAYWQSMKGPIEADRWFWDTRLGPNASGLSSARTYTIRLEDLCQQGKTTIRVHLRGYTGLAHHTQIFLNGRQIDDQRWSGQSAFTHQFVVDTSWLEGGRNQVEIRTLDTGAAIDQIFVDWIEVDHWRHFEAEDESLHFSTAEVESQTFVIDEFEDPAITVLDISNPAMPITINGGAIVPGGDQFLLHFTNTEMDATRMVASSITGMLSPDYVHTYAQTNWRSELNGADYILIAHESFLEAANRLATHRANDGFRSVVVPIHQLYDEFNHGLWGPQAIRNFLKHAYEYWQPPAPTYVLLLGDANQDYKDDKQTNTPTYVPTQVVATDLFGEVSSDNWFVAVSGDDILPDMFIGRVSVATAAQANAAVEKIIRYDQRSTDAAWNKSVLLVSDDDESRFQTISNNLAGNVPDDYTINHLYSTHADASDSIRLVIVNAINSGAGLISYIGHGEFFGWGTRGGAGEHIFHKEDIQHLTNSDRLPFVAVGNCLNGFFAGPHDKSSLAEELTRTANVGAIGVWAPSGYGYPTGHAILLENYYKATFANGLETFGAATTQAKVETYAQSSFWRDLVETYILFGDPAQGMAIPSRLPTITDVSPAHNMQHVPLDQPIRITFSQPMSRASVVLSIWPESSLIVTPTWDNSGKVVTVEHSGFAHETTYTVNVTGLTEDNRSIESGSTSVPWRFTSTADTVGPSAHILVAGFDGAIGTTDARSMLETSPFVIVFDEPVRTESFAYRLEPSKSTTLQWNDARTEVSVDHPRLTAGEIYTISILAAKDDMGNKLSHEESATFVVGKTHYVYVPYNGY